jgi:uncharacterized membrane protein YgaE (UPF0421/DUF939 family)
MKNPRASQTTLLTLLSIRYTRIILAIELVIGIIISYWLGVSVLNFSPDLSIPAINGLWAAISAALVIQDKEREAFLAACFRVSGVFIGCVLVGAFVSAFSYTLLALGFAVFCTTIFFALIRRLETIRVACVTVIVVFAVGSIHPEMSIWYNVLARFVESCVGIGVGLIAVGIFYPFRYFHRKTLERSNL